MAITWNDIKHHIDCTTQKEAYVYISMVTMVLLFGAVINDLIQFTVTERMDYTTQSFTMGILFMHAFGFYLALLAFIYNTQATYETGKMANLAAISLLGNVIVFILRVAIESCILFYRHEVYSSASESGK